VTEGYISTAVELHNSIADAINADDVLNKLVSAKVDSNGKLIVTYLVDGDVVSSSDDAIHVEFTGTAITTPTPDQADFIAAVKAEIGNSSLTDADVITAINEANGAGVDLAMQFAATGVDSTANGGDNVVNGGANDDVIVLSSDEYTTAATTGNPTSVAGLATFAANDQQDTLVMDAGSFGNDVVVHFTDTITVSNTVIGDSATDVTYAKDVLHFEFLDNEISTSGSVVSESRIGGTVATAATIVENSVVVVDVSAFTATSLETLTAANILADMNADNVTTWDGVLQTTTVGNVGKAILMVEDDGNSAATSDNEGYYQVYEVSYTDASGNFVVTDVNLAGTLDFGEAIVPLDGNIA
jgi:hypothetical protein